MAEIQDKIQPTEHLNRDDSDRSLPKGDVRDRLNCRVHVTQKGQDGDTENTQGNTRTRQKFLLLLLRRPLSQIYEHLETRRSFLRNRRKDKKQ